jgi:hypothetical protein
MPLHSGTRRSTLQASIPPLQALIAGLGSPTIIPGLYDALYHVTASGGTASAWDDARGIGIGPQIAQGTSLLQPSYDAVNGILSFNGSTQLMTTGQVSNFPLSATQPLWLGIIGANTETSSIATNKSLAQLANTAVTVYLRDVVVFSTTNYAAEGNDGTTNHRTSSLGVTTGPTTRLIVVGMASSQNVKAQIPNQAQQSGGAAGALATQSTMALQVGDSSSLTTTLTVRTVVVGTNTGFPTPSQLAALETYAATRGAIPG